MSTPQFASVPGAFADNRIIGFTAANGVLAKVLTDVAPAAGNLLGGQRAYDIVVSSTDTVANMLTLWEGFVATLYAGMGVAATTATTNATISRTVGSFLTDGYAVGDSVMCLGSIGASNNGNVGTLTAVTATTLTMNGVPTSFSANTEGAGFRVLRVARRTPTVIPASAGTATSVSAAVSNVQIVGAVNDKTTDNLGIELGANSVLMCSLYQAASALPATINVVAKSALR